MDTIVKKCLMPEDVILTYSFSFTPTDDKILGIVGRYMYIELLGFYRVPDADNDINDIIYKGETVDKTAVLKISINEFQRLFKLWILGKKDYCERWGHWCGVCGSFYPEEFKVVDYVQLTRYDETIDFESPEYVYYEEVPVVSVEKWNERPDFEHG